MFKREKNRVFMNENDDCYLTCIGYYATSSEGLRVYKSSRFKTLGEFVDRRL